MGIFSSQTQAIWKAKQRVQEPGKRCSYTGYPGGEPSQCVMYVCGMTTLARESDHFSLQSPLTRTASCRGPSGRPRPRLSTRPAGLGMPTHLVQASKTSLEGSSFNLSLHSLTTRGGISGKAAADFLIQHKPNNDN